MRRRSHIVNEMPLAKLPASETSFQTTVLDLADITGWTYWHIPKAAYAATKGAWSRDRQIRRGWPDWVFMRLGKKSRCVFVELKGTNTAATPEQIAVIEGLRLCGLEAHLFRPADWDKVVEVLQAD